MLGAAYTMDPIVLKAQYNQRDDVLKGFTTGADISVLTAGVRHSF
jgi:hypothetical protein